MSKKRKRKESSRQERDDLTSLLSQPPLPVRPARFTVPTLSVLRQIEDRRDYHPSGPKRAARTLLGTTAKVKRVPTILRKGTNRLLKSVQSASGVLGRDKVAFQMPERVVVCVRRKVRREVLFAKRATGKGSRSFKRRNEWSEVKC